MPQQPDVSPGRFRPSGRFAARVAFWLCLFPVLAGAITIPLVPMRVRADRARLATPGTDSYHEDARRSLAVNLGNAGVRCGGILLMVGFAVASGRESRSLHRAVFVSAVVLFAAHLALTIVAAGPMRMTAWANPLYFLPAAAIVVCAAALR